MEPSPLSPVLAHTVVKVDLHCRGCGYDLRGLPADGRCPECGIAVAESLLHVLDPAASRLPRLRDPAQVGNALFGLVVVLLAVTIMLGAAPVARWIDRLGWLGSTRVSSMVPTSLPLAAAAVLFVGILATILLAPSRGRAEDRVVWHSVWLLWGGLANWIIVLVAWWVYRGSGVEILPVAGRDLFGPVLEMLAVIAATVTFFGLRGVLQTIGLRSREFRTARGGRQRVRDIIAAVWGVAVGRAARVLAGYLAVNWLDIVGMIVFWISGLMLLIGLLYLTVNAYWIRRALRKPPPLAEDVLARNQGAEESRN